MSIVQGIPTVQDVQYVGDNLCSSSKVLSAIECDVEIPTQIVRVHLLSKYGEFPALQCIGPESNEVE